jgi:hypothetical protein
MTKAEELAIAFPLIASLVFDVDADAFARGRAEGIAEGKAKRTRRESCREHREQQPGERMELGTFLNHPNG